MPQPRFARRSTLILLALLAGYCALTTPALADTRPVKPDPPAEQDGPAATDSAPSQPPAGVEGLIALAESYQSGFLQVVPIACYQVYTSAVTCAERFNAGTTSGMAAGDELESSILLHSVCYTSLTDVLRLTDPADALATAELTRIRALLDREADFLSALDELFSDSDKTHAAANNAAAQKAKAALEDALDAYTAADAADTDIGGGPQAGQAAGQ